MTRRVDTWVLAATLWAFNVADLLLTRLAITNGWAIEANPLTAAWIMTPWGWVVKVGLVGLACGFLAAVWRSPWTLPALILANSLYLAVVLYNAGNVLGLT